jgi:hypothetical protein
MTDDDNEGKGGINAKIVVQGKDEIDKLTKENERLTAQLESIARKEFALAKERANLPDDVKDSITTPEELADFIKSEKEIEEKLRQKEEEERSRNPSLNPERGGHAGSGKAPLSGEPSGNLSTVKEYPNIDAMMQDLRERAQSSNKAVAEEAEQILAQLHKKQAESKKSHEFEVEIDIGKIGQDKRRIGTDAYNKAEEAGK